MQTYNVIAETNLDEEKNKDKKREE